MANVASSSSDVVGVLQKSTSTSLFSPGAREACDEAASLAGKAGNDKSDVNADEEVEKINGKGLVVLGTWIAERHDQYKKSWKGFTR